MNDESNQAPPRPEPGPGPVHHRTSPETTPSAPNPGTRPVAYTWPTGHPAFRDDEPEDGAMEEADLSHEEDDEGVETRDARREELADWKSALREHFEEWLESLNELPAEVSLDAADNIPDLYAQFEELVAAHSESRKANRRTADALSQWGEMLARFEGSLAPLRETTARLAAVQPKDQQLSRPHCLLLVELLDRLQRVARAFESPPPAKRSWWGGSDASWQAAWQAQRQALDIVVAHVDAWLTKEKVVRLNVMGQEFNPTTMMAVAAVDDPSRPPQTVVEELLAGYRLNDELLRPAQVKVTRGAGPTVSGGERIL